jgi:hypothetical protein
VAAGFDSVREVPAGFVSERDLVADLVSLPAVLLDDDLAVGDVSVREEREEADVRVDAVLLELTRSEDKAFAVTTPGPLNSPGFAVAATAGLPWLTEAN